MKWRASRLGWTWPVPLLGAGERSMQPPAPALFVLLLMALWREGGPSVCLTRVKKTAAQGLVKGTLLPEHCVGPPQLLE